MLTQLREMVAYNHWANERLFDACAKVSDDDLKRELGGSFPSAWLTLCHLYGAENSWLARWNGSPRGEKPDFAGIETLAALRTKWDDLWRRQLEFANALTEDDVRRPLPITFLSGRSLEQQLGATMRHCMNHSTYHRGQITNFLRMLGAEAIGIDLVLYYESFPPE